MKSRNHVRILFVAVLALLSVGALGVAWASDQAPSGAPAIAALTEGSPVAPSTVASAMLHGHDAATYLPDSAEARDVPAPTGGLPWLLVPARDHGACLVVGRTLTCGTGADVADGTFGIITIKETPEQLEADADARRAQLHRGGASTDGPVLTPLSDSVGEAWRIGIVPDGIASVAAVSSDGSTLSEAPVAHNAYRVSLGPEGQATAVVFRHADGGAAFTYRIH